MEVAEALMRGGVLNEHLVAAMAEFEPDRMAAGWNAGSEGFPSAERIGWMLMGADAGADWARDALKSSVVIDVDAHDRTADRLAGDLSSLEQSAVQALEAATRMAYDHELATLAGKVASRQPGQPEHHAFVKSITRAGKGPAHLLDNLLPSTTLDVEGQVMDSFGTLHRQVQRQFFALDTAVRSLIQAAMPAGTEADVTAVLDRYDPMQAADALVDKVRQALLIQVTTNRLKAAREDDDPVWAAVLAGLVSFWGAENMAESQDLRSAIEYAGFSIVGLEWVYGSVSTRTNPFPAHARLGGRIFSGPEDPELATSVEHASLGPFYKPRQITGCQCVWRTSLTRG